MRAAMAAKSGSRSTLTTARAGNRRKGLLRALRTHTKAPYKPDLLRETLRALKRPGRARTGQDSRRSSGRRLRLRLAGCVLRSRDELRRFVFRCGGGGVSYIRLRWAVDYNILQYLGACKTTRSPLEHLIRRRRRQQRPLRRCSKPAASPSPGNDGIQQGKNRPTKRK